MSMGLEHFACNGGASLAFLREMHCMVWASRAMVFRARCYEPSLRLDGALRIMKLLELGSVASKSEGSQMPFATLSESEPCLVLQPATYLTVSLSLPVMRDVDLWKDLFASCMIRGRLGVNREYGVTLLVLIVDCTVCTPALSISLCPKGFNPASLCLLPDHSLLFQSPPPPLLSLPQP